jgi:RNA polymerase-binding protein DksA
MPMSKPAPTTRDLKGYAARLRELVQRVGERGARLEAETLGAKPPAEAGPGDEPPAHEADPATRDAEDQVTLAVLESEKQVLTDSQAALDRIATGTFGACERCGHAISQVRLEAMPYARLCIHCAEPPAK